MNGMCVCESCEDLLTLYFYMEIFFIKRNCHTIFHFSHEFMILMRNVDISRLWKTFKIIDTHIFLPFFIFSFLHFSFHWCSQSLFIKNSIEIVMTFQEFCFPHARESFEFFVRYIFCCILRHFLYQVIKFYKLLIEMS